jgi:protease IV
MDKRAGPFLCLFVFVAAGCHNPITLHTESGVSLRTHAHVHMELAPQSDHDALVECVVPSGACQTGCAKVALIDLDGVLVNASCVGPYSVGENPVDLFKEKLDAAAADPAVRAVVLRVNSPGGAAAASDLMLAELRDFRVRTRKPVVAFLMDVGAGGAYYVATASNEVVALPSSLVGGLGVVFNLYHGQLAMEQVNFFDQSVRAGPKIDMGSVVRKQTDEEKAMFAEMAKEYQERLKSGVLAARPHVSADANVFDGRIMTADQAVRQGLVDEAGYLPDAIQAACRLACVPAAQTVVYRRPSDTARSVYATTANRPIQNNFAPWSVPGPDRARLPLFLYMWEPDPAVVRTTGL